MFHTSVPNENGEFPPGFDRVLECAGTRVLICAASGSKLSTGRDANDVIGSAREHDTAIVALTVARLSDDFLVLRSRVAGEIVQKFVTYHVHVVVVGDISMQIAGSQALRDFVYEANRGRHIWFVTDLSSALVLCISSRAAAG